MECQLDNEEDVVKDEDAATEEESRCCYVVDPCGCYVVEPCCACDDYCC